MTNDQLSKPEEISKIKKKVVRKRFFLKTFTTIKRQLLQQGFNDVDINFVFDEVYEEERKKEFARVSDTKVGIILNLIVLFIALTTIYYLRKDIYWLIDHLTLPDHKHRNYPLRK